MGKEQIASLLRLLAIVVTTIAGLFGITLDHETSADIAIGIALVAIVVYGCWKNQNLSLAACLGQEVTDAIKENILTTAEVNMFLDKAKENATPTDNTKE